FILYLAFAALNSITPLAAANEKPTLASSSLRYGSLMVDHWLTVDLVRQIERGLFYYPDPQTARTESDLDRLQQSVVAAELDLNHALELYRSLSASNSIERMAQLAERLDRAAETENANNRTAAELLQRLGQRRSAG